jgi:CheY-like chemotaxis protein
MKKVLVVDDEDHIREIAATSLEIVGGWSVITAGSGAEALSKAQTERPDAILLDVMMPEMDGPTVFRALRKNEETRSIPVILLTAKVQAAEREQFSDLGVDAVLAKPFDPMTLHREVAAALGWE